MAKGSSFKLVITIGILAFFVVLAAVLISKKIIIVSFLLCLLLVLIWFNPAVSLFVVLMLVPLNRSLDSSLIAPDTICVIRTALVYLACIAWLIKYRASENIYSLPGWIKTFIIIWFSIDLLSLMHSIDIVSSLEHLSLTLSAALLFVVCMKCEKSYLRTIVYQLVIVAGLISMLAMLEFVCATFGVFHSLWRFLFPSGVQIYLSQGPDMQRVTQLFRAQATFTHPNQLGLYLALILPFAFMLAGVKEFILRWRAVFLFIFVSILGGIFVTNSRASLLLTVISLIIFSMYKGYRWLIGITGVGLLLILLIFPGEIIQSNLSKISRQDSGLSGRPEVWRNSWEIIKSSPFLGVGPGNVQKAYVSRFGYFVFDNINEEMVQMENINIMGDKIVDFYHPHNTYLHLAGDLGIAAPVVYIVILLLLIIYFNDKAKCLPYYSYDRGVAIACASVITGLIVYGFFESHDPFLHVSLNMVAAPLLAAGLRAKNA